MVTKSRKTAAITLFPTCSDEELIRTLRFTYMVSTETVSNNRRRAVMIGRRILLIAALAALGMGLNQGVSAQPGQGTEASTPAGSEAVRSITVITVHGKIVEVNKAKKLVT